MKNLPSNFDRLPSSIQNLFLAGCHYRAGKMLLKVAPAYDYISMMCWMSFLVEDAMRDDDEGRNNVADIDRLLTEYADEFYLLINLDAAKLLKERLGIDAPVTLAA